MSKVSQRQQHIYTFVNDNGPTKRSAIVKRFRHWYYCNGEHHISEMLYRMVKAGTLRKPKHGYYEAVKTPRPSIPSSKSHVGPNQINLFK